MLSSAIPMSRCNTRYPNEIDHMYLYNRYERNRDEHPVSVSMYDIAEQRLPTFANRIVAPLAATLPGFTRVEHIRDLRMTTSKFAYPILIGSTTDYTRSIPKYLHVWSSYRWINKATLPSQASRYFLANLRTVYGTNPLLVKAEHPFRTLPNIPI